MPHPRIVPAGWRQLPNGLKHVGGILRLEVVPVVEGDQAIGVERFFDVVDDVVLPQEQLDAMLRTRTGALIGRDLAEEYGWSVGDRVPLRSARDRRKDGLEDWTFNIVGIFEYDSESIPANEFWINYDYYSKRGNSATGR